MNSGPSHSDWNEVIIIFWQGRGDGMCENALCKAQYNNIQNHRLIHL